MVSGQEGGPRGEAQRGELMVTLICQWSAKEMTREEIGDRAS